MDDLKRCVKQYRDIDDEIRVLNKKVYEKRDIRKSVELEMTDLIARPQFNSVDKLKIDDDGSCIKISRPGTYAKPWNLSKKELDVLLNSYFENTSSPNAKECSAYITEQRKRALVGKEFEFARVISEE
jgi:hypothetical protein